MTRTRRTGPLAARGLLPAALMFATMPLAAAAVDWSGGGGDGNWSTAANWVGGVAPASANSTFVTFGAAGATFAPVVDAPWTINRVDLTGATPYALSGLALTLDGASPQINVSGGAHSIANDLSFAATTTLDTSIDLTLSGTLIGTGGLTKAGTGRLILNGSPFTWGGTTTVAAGTLQIGDGASGPNTFFSPIVVNGAIEFAGANPLVTIQNTVTGAGTFTVSGGTVTAPGVPLTYTGATTVSGGTLSAQIVNNAPLVVSGAGTLHTGDSVFGSLAGSGTVFSDGTAITVGGDNTSTTFSGSLTGTGGLTKAGTGRLILNGSPFTWGGTTTVAAGTLQIGDGASGPNTFFSPIVVNGAIEFAGANPLVTIQNTVTGAGTFTVSGGTVTAPGVPLTYTGATTVSGGTLSAQIVNNAPLVVSGAGTLHTGDSVFGSLAGSGTVFSDGTAITVGGDNTSTTFSGSLTGTGGLTKAGTGRLILNGSPFTWGGTTTVAAGTLQIGDGASGPNTFFSPIVVNGAIEFAGANPLVTIQNTVTGAGTFTVSGGTVTAPGVPLTYTGATTVSGGTLSAQIVNNAPLVVSGAGTLHTGDSVFGSLAGSGTVFSDGTAITVGGDNTEHDLLRIAHWHGRPHQGGHGLAHALGREHVHGRARGERRVGPRDGIDARPGSSERRRDAGRDGHGGRPRHGQRGRHPGAGPEPGRHQHGQPEPRRDLPGRDRGHDSRYAVRQHQRHRHREHRRGDAHARGRLCARGRRHLHDHIERRGRSRDRNLRGPAEAATIAFNGAQLQISYVGGTGNDVVLTVTAAAPAAAIAIPTISAWGLAIAALLLGAFGAMAAGRRRGIIPPP